MSPNDADGMANSVDPDQTDLGLHCLPRPICLKTLDHYGTFVLSLSGTITKYYSKFATDHFYLCL